MKKTVRSMIKTGVFGFIVWVNSIRCHMSPYIVGPDHSTITDFPHSASINAYNCYNSSFKAHTTNWLCGASILTDRILISAAHCVKWCEHPDSHVDILYGSPNRDKSKVMKTKSYIAHFQYNERTLDADISLLKTRKALIFSDKVQRTAILHHDDVPYHELGYVAGWGNTKAEGEDAGRSSVSTGDPWLKHANQVISRRSECLQVMRSLPQGVVCGKSTKSYIYPSVGDSGSGLIIRAYIQVGMVSFKLPHISLNTIIYTDIGYYYDWITEKALLLTCS